MDRLYNYSHHCTSLLGHNSSGSPNLHFCKLFTGLQRFPDSAKKKHLYQSLYQSLSTKGTSTTIHVILKVMYTQLGYDNNTIMFTQLCVRSYSSYCALNSIPNVCIIMCVRGSCLLINLH